MRTQTLGRSTATLAAGTLAAATLAVAGLATAPAQAIGGIDGGDISGPGPLPTALDVATTGSGDAVAAWVRPTVGGVRIHAAVAQDGAWTSSSLVTPATVASATDLHVVANTQGDAVVVWTQLINGEERVRGSRYLGGGDWDGSAALSGADTTGITATDAAIDDAGRVHVVVAAEVNAADPIRATVWAKGAAPAFSPVDGYGVQPTIDATPAGVALIGYRGLKNGTDVAKVSRRTATTAWTAPDAALWPEDIIENVQVGLADDGTGTALFTGRDGSARRIVATKVGVDGSTGAPDVVSAGDLPVAARSLFVSPGGTALASWVDFDGSDYALRTAMRKPGNDFGTPSTVEADIAEQRPGLPFVTDAGAQVLVHDDGDELTFRHRTQSIHLFGTYEGGAADGLLAAAADRQGNVVAVSTVAAGNASYVQGDFLDVAAPTAKVTGPGARVLGTSFPVTWTATDSLSGVQSTDLIVRSAPWNGATFSAPAVAVDNSTGTSAPFTGAYGRTYCFEVQATDKVNNLGARSPLACTTVPLDDTSLTGKGWKRLKKAGHVGGTVSTTTRKGRVLTLKGVRAQRLALVVAKAAKGGRVEVRWNGKRIRTVSLRGKGKRVVVPIASFAGVQAGTVKIKVVSRTGRKVQVDGVIVAK